MKRFVHLGLSLVPVLALASTHVRAQFTYSGEVSTQPGTAQRLWLDTSQTQAAPAGTVLWIVGDRTGAGFPISTVTDGRIENINRGTEPFIQRFYTDTIPGDLTGSTAGRYEKTGIPVPDSLDSSSFALMLFNDANHNGTVGDAGDTFGYYSFGTFSPPAPLTDYQWLVSSDVHADQIVIVPVPEPAQGAFLTGFLCLCVMLVGYLRAAAGTVVLHPAGSGALQKLRVPGC